MCTLLYLQRSVRSDIKAHAINFMLRAAQQHVHRDIVLKKGRRKSKLPKWAGVN